MGKNSHAAYHEGSDEQQPSQSMLAIHAIFGHLLLMKILAGLLSQSSKGTAAGYYCTIVGAFLAEEGEKLRDLAG